MLVYTNSTDNANKIIDYIEKLLNKYFSKENNNLCYYAYHSKLDDNKQGEILTRFEQSEYGIIACVYCLGEGWDFPLLDAVVFAENMSSNIRIVQSALRAGRKYKNEPNKISKIIIPTIYKNNDGDFDTDDYKKITEIIKQMGLEDETIVQKIDVICQHLPIKKKLMDATLNNKDISYISDLENKIKTICISRERIGTTYLKAVKIIKNKSIVNKEDYYKLCEQDNRLPIEPDLVYKGQFTSWIDYLSIEWKYYDVVNCKEKIYKYYLEHNLRNNFLEMDEVCKKLCEIDDNFPPSGLWCDYYRIDNLNEIICLALPNKKKTKISPNIA